MAADGAGGTGGKVSLDTPSSNDPKQGQSHSSSLKWDWNHGQKCSLCESICEPRILKDIKGSPEAIQYLRPQPNSTQSKIKLEFLEFAWCAF